MNIIGKCEHFTEYIESYITSTLPNLLNKSFYE